VDDNTSASRGQAGNRGDALNAGNLDQGQCLSPSHIATVLTNTGELAVGNDIALYRETLRRVLCALAAPSATGLAYPPFALTPGERATLAGLALCGVNALVQSLIDRGDLSSGTARNLGSAITHALSELNAVTDTSAESSAF